MHSPDPIRFKVSAFNRSSVISLIVLFAAIFAMCALLLDGQARLAVLALTATILVFVIGHMASASVSLAPDALHVGAGLFRKRIAYADIVGTSRDASELKSHTMRLQLRREFDVVVGIEDPGALQRALQRQGVKLTSNEM